MEYEFVIRRGSSYITFREDSTSIDLIPYEDGSFAVRGRKDVIVPDYFAALSHKQYELLSKTLNYLKTTEGQHLVEKLRSLDTQPFILNRGRVL